MIPANDNRERRTRLTESRARVVAAADQARRVIEGDLHDGAQQRIVPLGMDLRAAQASVPEELGDLRDRSNRSVNTLSQVHWDLQELSRDSHFGDCARRRAHIDRDGQRRRRCRFSERLRVDRPTGPHSGGRWHVDGIEPTRCRHDSRSLSTRYQVADCTGHHSPTLPASSDDTNVSTDECSRYTRTTFAPGGHHAVHHHR